jgi:hypothetical protein
MDDLEGIDWVGYFHGLSADEMRELAVWLAAELLEVGEFMAIADRGYAQASEEWRGRSRAFAAQHGRPVAKGYARRKRRFAELMAALEEARMSGALPGEAAPQELQPIRPPWAEPRPVEELLGMLEHARSGVG